MPSEKLANVNYETLNQRFEKNSRDIPCLEHYRLLNLGNDTKFAEFCKEGYDIENDGVWKIHLNVDLQQLAEAWNNLHPLLVSLGAVHFKVLRLQAMEDSLAQAKQKLTQIDGNTDANTIRRLTKSYMDLKEDQQRMNGCQITIYIPNNEVPFYNRMLPHFEASLFALGICPGELSKTDRALGKYASRRYQGKAIPVEIPTQTIVERKQVQITTPACKLQDIRGRIVEIDSHLSKLNHFRPSENTVGYMPTKSELEADTEITDPFKELCTEGTPQWHKLAADVKHIAITRTKDLEDKKIQGDLQKVFTQYLFNLSLDRDFHDWCQRAIGFLDAKSPVSSIRLFHTTTWLDQYRDGKINAQDIFELLITTRKMLLVDAIDVERNQTKVGQIDTLLFEACQKLRSYFGVTLTPSPTSAI
jgi:hypothetical protein